MELRREIETHECQDLQGTSKINIIPLSPLPVPHAGDAQHLFASCVGRSGRGDHGRKQIGDMEHITGVGRGELRVHRSKIISEPSLSLEYPL